MGKTFDMENLQSASKALKTYMSDMQSNINKLYESAETCMDNLDHDEFSEKAVGKLQECVKQLDKSLELAKDLDDKIQKKIKDIDDMKQSF